MAALFKLSVVITLTVVVESYSLQTLDKGYLMQDKVDAANNRSIDDFMKELHGSCLGVNPETQPDELLKYSTIIFNRIRIYKEALDMKRKIVKEVQEVFDVTWDATEFEQVYNVMIRDSKEVCQVHDCSDIQPRTTGPHKIHAKGPTSFLVTCNMDVDGGNWTVIQQRQDGSVDFKRTWQEYKDGFGNPEGELWLGNEKIHRLTTSGKYELRVDLTSWEGESWYAVYKLFNIGDEESQYQLTLGQYSGTAGDSFDYHNGMKFTTKDRDNDLHQQNCSKLTGGEGGWWFRDCDKTNLNGLHLKGSGENGIEWQKAKRSYSMQFARMMIRRY